MREPYLQKVGHKKDWRLHSQAFVRLLSWLDEGTDSDGQKYLEMRQRLLAYFDRKDCLGAEDLTDETLDRVARRLEEQGRIEINTAAQYCYIVARFVFMEYLRGAKKVDAMVDDTRRQPTGDSLGAAGAEDGKEIKERMLNCLEQCTGKLKPQDRGMIIRYYTGKERAKIENRRALAEELEITMNALSIRACRIRDKIEACVRECVGTK